MAESRHCGKCIENWPTHNLKCPICGTATEKASADPMDEWEYHWLLYTGGKRPMKALPKAEEERVEAEWASLEAEAMRRGVSMVDCLEFGFRPGSVREAA